jgi:hypothetical protein
MPTPKHSREELAVHASFAWCMTDFLTSLGESNTARARRRLWQALKRAGIDISHWDRSPRRWYTDEALAAAVAASVSYAGALRVLGVPVTGGQHAHLARRIRRAGIDTSHFLGQAHSRGRKLPRLDPREVLVVLPEGSDRPGTQTLRSAMLRSGVTHVCGLCGCGPEWREGPLTLMIDHINGDWLDNRLENLRFLCPNCHSQTSTWCRKRSAREAS